MTPTEAAPAELPPAADGTELRLGAAVLEAAGLDGAEREAFLRGLEATQPVLAAEIRLRLAASEDLDDSFLSTPAAARLGAQAGEAADPSVPAPEISLPAAERYELGKTLGQGGMGRVLLAYDRQLARPVALKFLTRASPALRRLFLAEARAQARVQHEHVLPIYDSGELAGEPYIAMRYVPGGTLAEAAAGLTLEQKVRLLVQVAEGLHAAHREGLLHRDVKPSNVLLARTPDGDLRAQVSDFGLATRLDDAEGAAGEAIAGSPHFIAPERFLGGAAAADRRSDVYSLGITLYWLFTGAFPFAGQQTVDLLRQAAFEPLPPPRRHLPSLPAELEAIVLRCTARDPGGRYSSARAVASDLQRYLDGEVVEAYAAGLAYRLTRFALRHKVAVGLAALAAAAVVAGGIGVAVFALRADAARARAEMRQAQAEGLIRFMVDDLYKKLESLGRLDVLDAAGDEASRYFAAVPDGELSEAELLRRSQMLHQIGAVRIAQGNLRGAVEPMAKSLALARLLAARKPDDVERLFALGQSDYWAGYVHWQLGDLAAARPPFVAYLDVSRRLAAQDPKNPRWRRELSYAHSNLGSLLQKEGRLGDALEQYLATLSIDRDLSAAAPRDLAARSELAASHNTVGVVLEDLGRWPEAEAQLRAELELRRSLLAAEPASFEARDRLGTSENRLGSHLSLQGEWEEAARCFEEAREIFAALARHDPANAQWTFKLAWSHLYLGRAAFAEGDLAEAERQLAAGRRLLAGLLAKETPHAWLRTEAVGLYHLALVRRARGRPARPSLDPGLGILRKLAAARPTDREVHRWLSLGELLSGTLEASPAAASAAYGRAERAIAPFARGSRDGRVLAPWSAALRCLGRAAEAEAPEAALRELAYAEPGLAGICAVERAGPR